MGDTRDLIFGMLKYRLHIAQMSHVFTPRKLMQYGCQCQILTESSFGKSKDELDKACVGWHQCRKCVSIDENLFKNDKKCNPKLDMYQIGVNTDTGELSCELAANACER